MAKIKKQIKTINIFLVTWIKVYKNKFSQGAYIKIRPFFYVIQKTGIRAQS